MIEKEFANNFCNYIFSEENDSDKIALNILGTLESLEKTQDCLQAANLYKRTISLLKEKIEDVSIQREINPSLLKQRVSLLNKLVDSSTEEFGSIANNTEQYVQVCKEIHQVLNGLEDENSPYLLAHQAKKAIQNGDSEKAISFMSKIIEVYGQEFLAKEVNPYFLAAESDNEFLISSFIDAYIDPNLPKDDPPIMQILTYSYVDAAELLIRNSNINLNIRVLGNTPLTLAFISEGGEKLAQLILSKNVNLLEDLDQKLAVCLLACKLKNEKLDEFLFSKEIFSDELIEKHGHELFHEAINYKNNSMIDFLLEKNIDFNVPCNGEYAIHKAVVDHNYKLVEILIKKGADPNVHSLERETSPLLEAMVSKDLKMVKLLLELGANPLEKGYIKGQSHYFLLKIKSMSDQESYKSISEIFSEKNQYFKKYFQHEQLLKELGHSLETDITAKIKFTPTQQTDDFTLRAMPSRVEGARRMFYRVEKMIDKNLQDKNHLIETEEGKKLKKMISSSVETTDAEQILSLINKGEFFALPTGYSAHIGYLFFCGDYVIHCDRSVAPGEKVIHFYKYDKEQLDVRAIEELRKIHSSRPSYERFIQNDLKEKHGFQTLPISDFLEKSCVLEHQKTGNCTFASAVTVVNAALMMMAIKKENIDLEKTEISSLYKPIEESQQKCVDFIRWTQLDLLENYLLETCLGEEIQFEPDHQLIRVAFNQAWEANKNEPDIKFFDKLKELESKYLEKLTLKGEVRLVEEFKIEKIKNINL